MDDDDEYGDFFGGDNFADEPTIEEENDETPNDAQVLNKLFAGNDQPGKKRNAQRPQPKLNEATLMGPKGISALRESFKDYTIDPKGDPYSTLSTMMRKYEHWAHVMFPKLKFEDVISRCETLGDKRPVKVFMMKSRLDMPITDEDYEALSTKQRKNDIIETENNEDLAISRRDDSDDDEENFYDPFANDKPKNSVSASPTPAKTKSSSYQEIEVDEDSFLREAEEAERLAAEEEQRRMEMEADAMMDDMADMM